MRRLFALLAVGLTALASAQAPPGLTRFGTEVAPAVGDCVAVQALTSSGVVVGDAGVGACIGAMQSVSYATPTTGFTITIPNGTSVEVLNPAGTLASGTLTMPAAPVAWQQTCVSTSQTITALTVNANAGQTIIAAPTSMGAGGFCYLYDLANTTWFRLY